MIDLVIMLATPVVFHHLKISLQFCGGKVLAQHHAELLPATTSPRREPGHRPLQWRNDLRPGEGWASLHAKPTLGVIHSIPLRKMHGSLQEMMGKESLNYTILETRFNLYIYIPRSQVCFLLRCLPTNQVLCVKDCLLTKSSVIWKRVMFWKWPTVTILIWSIPGVHHVISWVPILSSRVVNPFPESSNL
jgi:hypothetical protein